MTQFFENKNQKQVILTLKDTDFKVNFDNVNLY